MSLMSRCFSLPDFRRYSVHIAVRQVRHLRRRVQGGQKRGHHQHHRLRRADLLRTAVGHLCPAPHHPGDLADVQNETQVRKWSKNLFSRSQFQKQVLTVLTKVDPRLTRIFDWP